VVRLARNSVLVLVLSMGLVGLLGGCGEQDGGSEGKTRTPLTERQRDSTIATTDLPGAKVVGRAMELSDSAAARAKRMNNDGD
jgi:hypothetical protein